MCGSQSVYVKTYVPVWLMNSLFADQSPTLWLLTTHITQSVDDVERADHKSASTTVVLHLHENMDNQDDKGWTTNLSQIYLIYMFFNIYIHL